MKEYIEKTIICKDCEKAFTLSVGEQKFYDEKGLTCPIRCKECRAKRKASFEKKEEMPKVTSSSKKTMTQKEIDDILKSWEANTVYFKDIPKSNNLKTRNK